MMNTEPSIIEIDNLKKTYHVGMETIHALNGISINIDHNEFVAIMGSSGSGKSTLMNIIGILDRPTTGKYFFEGYDINAVNVTEQAHLRNKCIGFVFQSFELLPRMTALENVELPLIYSNERKQIRLTKAKHALDRVGLSDRLHHHPNQLSGGQKQRVAIARALINSPSLILADEPTGNLDNETTNEIISLLSQLHGDGHTIIIVTHEDDVAAKCNRIIKLNDGSITSDALVLGKIDDF